MSNSKPVVFLDFDGVVETIYWENEYSSIISG